MLKKQVMILIILIILLFISILGIKLTNKKNDTYDKKVKTTAKKVDEQLVKLTLVGDLLFESPFYDAISKGDDENEYFSLVKDYFKNDDLSIGNMEVVIGNDELKTSGDGYNFCAPSWVGNLVNTLDFQVLSTANNHSYDRGIKGVFSTIDFFKNNTNILTVGTYKDESEREKIHTLTINDIKFSFLSYTLGTNIKVDDKYKNLVALYKDPNLKVITDEYKEKIKNEVEYAKNNSDVLIVILHSGTEFTYIPNQEQENITNYLNSLGVDIIVGSHSHSIQPIKWIDKKNKTLVFYSLGNFVSADNDISRTDKEFDNAYQFGLIANLTIKKQKDKIKIDNIKSEVVVNYYNDAMRNFKLVPLKYYDNYEKTHYRYKYGLTKEFINNTFNKVINENFR